jgi:hypothetical protein
MVAPYMCEIFSNKKYILVGCIHRLYRLLKVEADRSDFRYLQTVVTSTSYNGS